MQRAGAMTRILPLFAVAVGALCACAQGRQLEVLHSASATEAPAVLPHASRRLFILPGPGDRGESTTSSDGARSQHLIDVLLELSISTMWMRVHILLCSKLSLHTTLRQRGAQSLLTALQHVRLQVLLHALLLMASACKMQLSCIRKLRLQQSTICVQCSLQSKVHYRLR